MKVMRDNKPYSYWNEMQRNAMRHTEKVFADLSSPAYPSAPLTSLADRKFEMHESIY